MSAPNSARVTAVRNLIGSPTVRRWDHQVRTSSLADLHDVPTMSSAPMACDSQRRHARVVKISFGTPSDPRSDLSSRGLRLCQRKLHSSLDHSMSTRSGRLNAWQMR